MPDPTAAPATPVAAAAGRPRDAAADREILRAAFHLLVEHGYGGMSIEGVAAAAGVAKTTVYRRYPTKRDLVVAALTFGAPFEPDIAADLETHEALRRFVRVGRRALVESGAIRVLASLLVEQVRDPELLALFRQRILQPRLGIITGLLRRGIERGEVRPDVNPLLIAEMAGGALLAQHLILAQEGDEAWLDALADHLWAAIRSAKDGSPR